MAKDVIMPALGMAQETGTLIQWLKAPGETITKGEPLMEIETDKATLEVEAPASGILANVTARSGDVIPVGQPIAVILAPGESAAPAPAVLEATPVARRIAAEHKLDLAQVKPQGGRVQKEDVLAYVAARQNPPVSDTPSSQTRPNSEGEVRDFSRVFARVLASPKARHLAQSRSLDLSLLRGSGPEGAVLAADVLTAPSASLEAAETLPEPVSSQETETVSRLWRIMAERITQAWTTVPHFYLLREVNATRLIAWLSETRARSTEKLTYIDLLVKVAAAALRQHPRLNGSWQDGTIVLNREVNVGLAVAVEDGLVVPVIHHADQLGLSQIAARRIELVAKAQSGKLPPADLSGGTFTISNLGMYGVDAFNAIVNPPQAAILAVSRIAERVVPLKGQGETEFRIAVQPMISLSLSCDHRVVDGARGAQFLQTLANLIEDPLRLLD